MVEKSSSAGGGDGRFEAYLREVGEDEALKLPWVGINDAVTPFENAKEQASCISKHASTLQKIDAEIKKTGVFYEQYPEKKTLMKDIMELQSEISKEVAAINTAQAKRDLKTYNDNKEQGVCKKIYTLSSGDAKTWNDKPIEDSGKQRRYKIYDKKGNLVGNRVVVVRELRKGQGLYGVPVNITKKSTDTVMECEFSDKDVVSFTGSPWKSIDAALSDKMIADLADRGNSTYTYALNKHKRPDNTK